MHQVDSSDPPWDIQENRLPVALVLSTYPEWSITASPAILQAQRCSLRRIHTIVLARHSPKKQKKSLTYQTAALTDTSRRFLCQLRTHGNTHPTQNAMKCCHFWCRKWNLSFPIRPSTSVTRDLLQEAKDSSPSIVNVISYP